MSKAEELVKVCGLLTNWGCEESTARQAAVQIVSGHPCDIDAVFLCDNLVEQKEAAASKRVKEVVELRDLLVENNIIEHGALRIAVECVYGLKEDFYRHNKTIDISMLQHAEDVCWDAAHDEKIKQEVSELLQSKGEPVFQENVPKDQSL